MAVNSTQLTVSKIEEATTATATATTPATGKMVIQIKAQVKTEKKVGVVYYLARNGELEHPHFMELTLSSPQGLYLRDVIDALNLLRGQGMASMYSWASKRSYRNGYLWQDLSDDELIHPIHGQDYILKGSLLLETCLSFRSTDSASSTSRSRSHSSETNNSSSEDTNSPPARRTNSSWSSSDGINGENKVYKAKTSSELSRTGSNVSTQTTGDVIRRVESEIGEAKAEEVSIVNLSRKEMNEPILKSTQVHNSGNNVRYEKVLREQHRGKMKDSNLVMKLIGCGCGSKRFNDFEKIHNQ
ncbi:protein SOSEKI 5-like [Euphorbia lathyris]|uniref:protein SOSEKI 5-like n=1 Tax=Euphorbia lathyris TaxID=212925 RepID=UPI0033140E2B